MYRNLTGLKICRFSLLFIISYIGIKMFISAGISTHSKTKNMYDPDFERKSSTMFKEKEQQYNIYKFSNAFDIPQIEFLPNYKNPCWYETVFNELNEEGIKVNGAKRLQCFPYFFIAGFEKCGTTDIYQSVTTHPSILYPMTKECHFFGREQWMGYTFGNFYLRWLRNATSMLENEYQYKENGSRYHANIIVDASANTLVDQYVWKTFEKEVNVANPEPKFSTPLQLKRLLPNSKFIVMIRNPTERLYSSYLFYPLLNVHERQSKELVFESFKSKSAEDFHLRVETAIQYYKNCTTTFGLDAKKCIHYNSGESTQDLFMSKLQIGLYSPILEEWMEQFPIEQFKFIRIEDYSSDKFNVLNDVFSFLQVDQMTKEKYDIVINDGRARSNNARKQRIGPMLQETREMLQEFYRPFNEKLASLLQDENFLLYNN